MFLDELLGLDFNQKQVDFINPNLDKDLRLYVDPFQFYKSDNIEYHAVHTCLVKFFEIAIDQVKKGQEKVAKRMIRFPEVQEAMLGLCKNGFEGRGSGSERGELIYEAIVKDSEIQKFGLKHIEELQIKIRNVGYDMLSDMTLNIAKQFFINYTQNQAQLIGIKLTKIPIENIFNFKDLEWDGEYCDLPINPKNHKPMLFVPKDVVRTIPEMNSKDFYERIYRFILMAREIERSLKTLGKPTKISWKDAEKILLLKKETKKNWKDLAYYKEETIKALENEPKLLKQYILEKENGIVRGKVRKKKTFVVSAVKNADPRYTKTEDYIKQLDVIKPGIEDAKKYQDLMTKIITDLFSPKLSYPKPQDTTVDGLEIRDLTFWNSATEGFWLDIKQSKKLNNLEVTFEFKNYNGKLVNKDFNQISGYLNERRGNLGFLVCRSIPTDTEINRAERKLEKGEVIIILCDEDIKKMLDLRDNNKNHEEVLVEHIRGI